MGNVALLQNASCPICGHKRIRILNYREEADNTVHVLKECKRCKSIFEEVFQYTETDWLEVRV